MICLKPLKQDNETLNIVAVQVGSEVHLRREGEDHSFVIVKRDENGNAVVGINDFDTGVKEWRELSLLAWER